MLINTSYLNIKAILYHMIIICCLVIYLFCLLFMELAWRSGCVMACHATARGSIQGGNGVKTELHVLRKGQ